MRVRKPLSNNILTELAIRIKNGVDCSDFLEPYDLRGANLANVRCQRFVRNQEDLSGTNFSGAWLPHAEFIQSNLQRCNFAGANLEKANGASGDFRFCNFNDVFAPYAVWRYADFRYATFSGAIIRFACDESYGARFSKEFFHALTRHWKIEGFERGAP